MQIEPDSYSVINVNGELPEGVVKYLEANLNDKPIPDEARGASHYLCAKYNTSSMAKIGITLMKEGFIKVMCLCLAFGAVMDNNQSCLRTSRLSGASRTRTCSRFALDLQGDQSIDFFNIPFSYQLSVPNLS